MDAVVVDDRLMVDVELGTVIGQERELVFALPLDSESTGVVDGEPLETVRDAGEPLRETAWRDVQAVRIDSANRFQFLEVWQ